MIDLDTAFYNHYENNYFKQGWLMDAKITEYKLMRNKILI